MALFSIRLAVLVPALSVALALGACGGASSQPEAQADGATAPSATEKPAAGPLDVKASDMVLGSVDAPVTIVEYASLTCPACANFHETIFPTIKEKFVDTGKVRFVFREFPTPPVEFSLIGSVMARCAADKGGSAAYFLIAGSLFKTQRDWIYGEDPKAQLLKIAAQTGMDEAAFDACLRRQELVDAINAETKIASETLNVTGTPSFFLDGEKMTARSAAEFEAAIEAAVAKKGA